MGLIVRLKHTQKNQSGWEYRRRVPKDVAEIVGKREFKRGLGSTEAAAVRA